MRLVSDLSSVRAVGIEFRFGDTVALAASDFELPAVGVSALIGPNGSGKSTVLAGIAGLHRPSRGTIEVLGTDPESARSRVAFVPQSTKVNDVLPVTVREVVAMGRYASLGMARRFTVTDREAVDEALERLDLAAIQTRHLRELSGGQRQRVFVAQGLVQARDILLLDEPTMALDLVSERVIHDAISREREEGRPVVVTTHDLGEARSADHVLLLANRVVAAGSPAAVLTPENLTIAYRSEIGEAGAQMHVDDAAHRPTAGRHTHLEAPGHGAVHPGRDH